MNAKIEINGWTMEIVWTHTQKVVTFKSVDALTAKRYTLRDASNYVYEMVDDAIAKRIFLALLASA